MSGVLVVAEARRGELRDVTFELIGAAREADARGVGAKVEPSSGERKECAWSSSAMSVFPARWKVAAARIRIEALITKAKHSAIVVSMVASEIASRFSAGVSP